jgi:plasmid maintenance system antidote protein VapI
LVKGRQANGGSHPEQYAVTPEMAARIGKLCGNGPGLWLRTRQAHDLWGVEHEMADELARIPTMSTHLAA